MMTRAFIDWATETQVSLLTMWSSAGCRPWPDHDLDSVDMSLGHNRDTSYIVSYHCRLLESDTFSAQPISFQRVSIWVTHDTNGRSRCASRHRGEYAYGLCLRMTSSEFDPSRDSGCTWPIGVHNTVRKSKHQTASQQCRSYHLMIRLI